MIKISIIVPIYNVEKQLERCIESLLKQEDKDLQTEIVLVNDGSTDDSGKIAKEYALKYKDKEIEMHKKELLNKPNKTSKDWFDIISISLSSLYSNNGQNWGKSLFMTIFITFVFFNIFYLPDLSKSNIEPYFYKDYFSCLIKYFIPTDYEQIKYYADASVRVNIFVKVFGVIIYFVGKIMFWYGSVQTVQAFRKFSKGA